MYIDDIYMGVAYAGQNVIQLADINIPNNAVTGGTTACCYTATFYVNGISGGFYSGAIWSFFMLLHALVIIWNVHVWAVIYVDTNHSVYFGHWDAYIPREAIGLYIPDDAIASFVWFKGYDYLVDGTTPVTDWNRFVYDVLNGIFNGVIKAALPTIHEKGGDKMLELAKTYFW